MNNQIIKDAKLRMDKSILLVVRRKKPMKSKFFLNTFKITIAPRLITNVMKDENLKIMAT